MRLIFIRHGQAEDATENIGDARRVLTAKGKERLENVYPAFARYLNSKKHCEVWTSPKARALETANVLCRYMPGVKPLTQNFLEEGNFDAFCRAIRAHDHGETLVVVGHEPYLSDWVREMTGLDVHFKKGRGEMLYLSPTQPTNAIRIHDIDFDQMRSLDLYRMPLSIGIATMIQNQHHHIIHARDQFLTDPDDNDALSTLRVALRRQYALLEFIKPYCKQKAFTKAESQYLALYHDLETLRGLNAILKTIHNSRKLELFPLSDELMMEQTTMVIDLCNELSQPENEIAYQEALHLTIAALMTANTTAPLDQLAREQFASRYKEVQDALITTDFTSLEQSEALRKLCKTSRYLFEFFSPLANFHEAQQYLRIRRLNQRLSTYCDTYYNVAQLEDILGEDKSPALARATKVYRDMMAQSGTTQLESIENLLEDIRADVEPTNDKGKKNGDKKKRKK
ncbi:MAG: CHAD domain-containing protein [Peptococcaceae bacterium]|mgnify:FL=1|jgi:phosphohistidine phosphatase|nr:CHAD domain-containing protein [Peptococcaceae bacterium]